MYIGTREGMVITYSFVRTICCPICLVLESDTRSICYQKFTLRIFFIIFLLGLRITRQKSRESSVELGQGSNKK